MAEIDTGAVRSQRFSAVRKGYDRAEVDAYLAELAGHIEALDARIVGLEGQFEQLGIEEPRDLAAELETVGEEVAAVLSEARSAAEAMRRRASEDAARWRSETDEELRRRRAETDEQVEALRRSAWEESTEAVEQAVNTRDEMIAAAEQDVMLLRAEAEHEASRLTGDARRIREEATLGAREDAERIVADARSEAEAILATATREAEVAQRRAQALEARRVELLNELEATQASIGGPAPLPPAPGAEEPEEGPGLEAVDEPVPELRPFDEEAHRTHWGRDEVGSVKIVSGDRVVRRGPVDADALAAEVQALREREGGESAASTPDAVGPTPDAPGRAVLEPPLSGPPPPEVEPVVEAEPAPEAPAGPAAVPEAETVADVVPEAESEAGPAPESVRVAEPDGEPEPEAEAEGESEAGPEVASKGEAAPGGDLAHEVERDSVAGAESEPEVAQDSAPPEEGPGTGREEAAGAGDGSNDDSLAGLFDRLRHPSPAARDEGGDEAGDRDEPTAPTTPHSPSPDETRTVAAMADVDPFSLRDRSLLPIQNRALRSIKRQLVDLQNQALGGLRADDAWSVDAEFFAKPIRGDLAVMARESTIAGMVAASELTGAESTPSAGDVPSPDPTDDFAAALAEAAESALGRSREAGAGARETAAALSRVFRSWRTDEAERRVRAASFAAYHAGLVASADAIGVSRVSVESVGHACPECPAGRGTWAIGEGPPAGTSMPPARIDCVCVVVPSG